MSKIFGIGLSRTGTSSLAQALEDLGYKSKHFPKIEKEIVTAKYRLEILDEEGFDALTDTPIVPIFRNLDIAYPGSKFILTTRDKESWLQSCEKYFSLKIQREFGTPKETNLKFHLLYTYGSYSFSRARWSVVFDNHHELVMNYFKNRSDLLVMKICEGEGWNKLCPFLNIPIPSFPFPSLNGFSKFLNKKHNNL